MRKVKNITIRGNSQKALDVYKGLEGALSFGRDIKSAYQDAERWVKLRNTWTVSINVNDRLYSLILHWALEQVKIDDQKRVSVKYVRPDGDMTASIQTMYDPTSGVLHFKVNGHPIILSTRNRDSNETSVGVLNTIIEANSTSSGNAAPPLLLHAKTPEGRAAVLKVLKQLTVNSGDKPGIYQYTPWGDWQRRDLPSRDMSTVILEDNLGERVVDDLKRFISSESDYERMGIPWHRGYLFHGVPGTGKTSLVLAMANNLNTSVYYLSLSGIKKDSDLESLVSQVPPRSILLIEDIDVYGAAFERVEKEGSVSMSGLLNILDGVITPHGLITVLTTNNLETLDAALVRPGRADFVAEIGLPTKKQTLELVNKFAPAAATHAAFTAAVKVSELKPGVSTAAIVSVIKEHLHKPASELATELAAQLFGQPSKTSAPASRRSRAKLDGKPTV